MEIALVAGEASGDFLAAAMVRAFLKENPNARFFGIGGEKMQAAGVEIVCPMHALSVMGYVDAIFRLPALLKTRAKIKKEILKRRPLAFIGVDAPDFNLGLEKKIKSAGIPTAHFVSPSVWAWRARRVFSIAQSVDEIWTLFPHEPPIYEKVNLPAHFVGHPLADEIPFTTNNLEALKKLNLNENHPVFAFLPGSREGELVRHSFLFIQTAKALLFHLPQAQFVVPLLNDSHIQMFKNAFPEKESEAHFLFLKGKVSDALAACDVALVASGTATLEAALYKKPMVITYQLPPLNFYLAQKLLKSPWVGLPNILLQQSVVPEILQNEATPKNLSSALLELFQNEEKRKKIEEDFLRLHRTLKQNAAGKAALLLQKLVDRKNAHAL